MRDVHRQEAEAEHREPKGDPTAKPDTIRMRSRCLAARRLAGTTRARWARAVPEWTDEGVAEQDARLRHCLRCVTPRVQPLAEQASLEVPPVRALAPAIAARSAARRSRAAHRSVARRSCAIERTDAWPH